MGDRPDRTGCFPFQVKRNQQALFGRRRCRQKIAVTSFGVLEQLWGVTIEHVAARAKIARRSATEVRLPRAGDGRPEEALFVFAQQTDACRVGLEDVHYLLGQRLKNGARRVGQRLSQSHQRAVFRLVIRRTGRTLLQFLGAQDRFQRNKAFAGKRGRRLRFDGFRVLFNLERIARGLTVPLTQFVDLSLQLTNHVQFTTGRDMFETSQVLRVQARWGVAWPRRVIRRLARIGHSGPRSDFVCIIAKRLF